MKRFARLVVGLLALLSSQAFALQMEVDYVTVNGNAWVSVTFAQPFPSVPVVVSLTDDKGGQPGAVRVRNVTTLGFEIGVLEPADENGSYPTTTLPYLAVEEGVHAFPNGDLLQAGSALVSQQQRGYLALFPAEGWAAQSFATPFPVAAVVVATIQTVNNQPAGGPGTPSIPFLTTAIDNVSTTGFDTALERSEWGDGGNVVVAEKVGWVAMAAGTFGSFNASDGSSVQYETFNTGDNVEGWDEGCYQRPSTNFVNTYADDPVVVASKNSHDGNDGGWVRMCDLDTTQVGLTIDDRETLAFPRGTERVHTTEEVGVLVFERAFLSAQQEAQPSVRKTVLVNDDPINNDVNPKAIPGAEVLYTIRVENLGDGAATNVQLDDPVPNNMDLYVSNTENCGSVVYRDGTPSSGLSCLMANVSYDDGSGNYTYLPTPDADGFDPLVTDVRINFSGSLAANSGAGNPSLEVDLRMRVR